MNRNINIELFEKYAKPLYMYLLGTNKIYDLPVTEQKLFVKKYKEINNSINDETLAALLYDRNWRCSLVGAWLIFSANKEQFIGDIGQLLVQGKGGIIGFCFALSKFGNSGGAYYLLEYLKKELQFDKYPNERFQNYAYASLLYIDRQTGSNNIEEISALWDAFLNFDFSFADQLGSTLANTRDWGKIEESYSDFVRLYNYIDAI